MEHSSPPETNIEALKKEWDDLYKYPFPPIPEDEYLNELFAELALTDTFNAGIVSSFLKGKKVDRMLITIDTELNEKLSSYQPQSKEAKKGASTHTKLVNSGFSQSLHPQQQHLKSGRFS